MCEEYDGSLNPFGDYNGNGSFDAQDELIFETYFGDQSEEDAFDGYSESEDWEEEDNEGPDLEGYIEDETFQAAGTIDPIGWEMKKTEETIEKSKRRNRERKAKLARKTKKENKKNSSKKKKESLPDEVMSVQSAQRYLWKSYKHLVLEVDPNNEEGIKNWEQLMFCAYGLMIRSWNRPLNQKQIKNILLCHSDWSMKCSKEEFKKILIDEKGKNLPTVEEVIETIIKMLDETNGKNRRRMELLASEICHNYRNLQNEFAFQIFKSAPDDAGEEFAEKMEETIDDYFETN